MRDDFYVQKGMPSLHCSYKIQSWQCGNSWALFSVVGLVLVLFFLNTHTKIFIKIQRRLFFLKSACAHTLFLSLLTIGLLLQTLFPSPSCLVSCYVFKEIEYISSWNYYWVIASQERTSPLELAWNISFSIKRPDWDWHVWLGIQSCPSRCSSDFRMLKISWW